MMKAFPTADFIIDNTKQGMDLRDYFAAKALNAILMDFKYREMLFETAGDEKVSDPEIATRLSKLII